MPFTLKSLVYGLVICLCIENVSTVKLSIGNLYLTVSEQHHDDINYKVNLNSKIKTHLQLTQSSRIKIEGKLQFSDSQFKPQFFSFRLRHPTYQNLSEPVLAKYDTQKESYIVKIDLGDPKQIKPFSDRYQLEVILADESLDKNVRNVIAECNVKFRKSWTQIPSSQLHYNTQSIIQTSAPIQRVDPPAIFTLFIVLFIIVVGFIFLYGLNYLQVNVKLFPKTSVGFLVNIGLLVVLMANLAILLKFWINWTFLDTLQYLLFLILPTALVANYALIHVKKN